MKVLLGITLGEADEILRCMGLAGPVKHWLKNAHLKKLHHEKLVAKIGAARTHSKSGTSPLLKSPKLQK